MYKLTLIKYRNKLGIIVKAEIINNNKLIYIQIIKFILKFSYILRIPSSGILIRNKYLSA